MANFDKNHLLKRIEALENDELSAVLDADISFFQGEADVLDSISPADQEELQQMVNGYLNPHSYKSGRVD